MDDRRRYSRLDKECRLEYGPFSALMQHDQLKPGLLLNMSGGGALFRAHEKFQAGAQLFLKIHIAGWKHQSGGRVQPCEKGAELLLMTVTEVLHAAADESGGFQTGVRFLGQVRP
jgi:hypothetical protein